MSLLYESGDYGVWTFLALTIVLGGAAAMATGRALALTWRPLWQCFVYAVPLAFTIAFLHFALFEESVIPLQTIIEDTTDAPGLIAKIGAVASHLRGWAVQFIIFAVLALTGYRLTRVRQMLRQYGFACVSKGPFQWATKG
jgi:hypothetical protein